MEHRDVHARLHSEAFERELNDLATLAQRSGATTRISSSALLQIIDILRVVRAPTYRKPRSPRTPESLTQERLHKLLRYDPETGQFIRIVAVSTQKAGTVAGRLCTVHGYCLISVDGRRYRAHRLAWLHAYGRWPQEHIDHINGDRADNRLENLREATGSQNSQNSKRPKHNTSGYKGVSWEPRSGKWLAHISVSGHLRRLGLFDDKATAAEAYAEAGRLYFGDFFRPE